MRNDTTLFGERTSNIRQLAMNDPEYEKRKLSIVRRFFVVLRSCKSTAPLAEVFDDPNEPGTKLGHFYIACRGPRNTQKRKVFGQALLLFFISIMANQIQRCRCDYTLCICYCCSTFYC